MGLNGQHCFRKVWDVLLERERVDEDSLEGRRPDDRGTHGLLSRLFTGLGTGTVPLHPSTHTRSTCFSRAFHRFGHGARAPPPIKPHLINGLGQASRLRVLLKICWRVGGPTTSASTACFPGFSPVRARGPCRSIDSARLDQRPGAGGSGHGAAFPPLKWAATGRRGRAGAPD